MIRRQLALCCCLACSPTRPAIPTRCPHLPPSPTRAQLDADLTSPAAQHRPSGWRVHDAHQVHHQLRRACDSFRGLRSGRLEVRHVPQVTLARHPRRVHLERVGGGVDVHGEGRGSVHVHLALYGILALCSSYHVMSIPYEGLISSPDDAAGWRHPLLALPDTKPSCCYSVALSLPPRPFPFPSCARPPPLSSLSKHPPHSPAQPPPPPTGSRPPVPPFQPSSASSMSASRSLPDSSCSPTTTSSSWPLSPNKDDAAVDHPSAELPCVDGAVERSADHSHAERDVCFGSGPESPVNKFRCIDE